MHCQNEATVMGPLIATLRDFLRILDERNLEYALMGGFAVRAYGIPRPTYDVDFTIGIPREELNSFYESLEESGYTVPEQYRSGWVDQIAGMPLVKFKLYIGSESIDVDVFLAESDYQKELLKRRRKAEIDNLTAWLVTPEDLLLLKLIANRPRDLGDIADIRVVQGDLDEPYMRHWAAELDIADRLEKMLSEPPL